MGIMGCTLYASALNNPFHFDDLHSIQYNPHIRSLTNIPTFFVDLHTFSSERSGTMFRPLLLCSYVLNYALHGEWVVGYRLVNLGLHIACAWALWRLVRLWRGSLPMAYVVGGLLLFHPLAAEPVNYISSRSDILSAFFVLLALLAVGTNRRDGMWNILASYTGALLVKSVSIVLLPLSALGMEGTWGQRLRAEGRLFVALGVVSMGYIGILVANRFLADSLSKAPRALDVQVWTQIKAWVYALWLAIAPFHLSVDHVFAEAHGVTDGVVLSAGLFLVSLLSVALYAYRHWLGRGLLWWGIALAPYGLVPLNIVVSERRIYLASMGLLIVFGWALGDLLQRRRQISRVVFAIEAVCCSLIVTQRNAVWASDISLWEDALRPGSVQPRVQVNLALAYGRADKWDASRAQLESALEISPDFADAWVELGNIELNMGRVEQAQRAYERAVEYQPWLAGAHYNLGNIILGRGDAAGALQRYERALELNPNFAMAHNNGGQAREALGDVEGALSGYRNALSIDSHQPQAGCNLAHVLERRGERSEAGRAYRTAYELLISSEDYLENPQYQAYAKRAQEGARRLGALE